MDGPTKGGRGRVYARGGMLWLDYTDETGRRRRQSSGLRVGREKEAEKILRAIVRRLEAEPEGGTVAAWAETWLEDHLARGLASAHEDERRVRLYILPTIGKGEAAICLGRMRLEEVTALHVRRWIAQLSKQPSRKGGTLAPRTVRLAYQTLQAMMRDAEDAGRVEKNPCSLRRGQLPSVDDKDPEWRSSARFSRSELEILLSHPDIPLDRRVAYGLLGLGGLRWGEAAARRWRHYDPTVRPLGRLLVETSYDSAKRQTKKTKTGVVRAVPVHPVLAQLLSAWRLRTGAHDDDLILPPSDREAPARSNKQALRELHQDLAMLGMRPRRVHDFRRTMISLAQDDGAHAEVVRQITHRPPGDILEAYTTREWTTLCGAVQVMRIGAREGEVVPLQAAAGAEDQGTVGAHPDRGQKKAPQDRDLAGPVLVAGTGFESVARPPARSGSSRLTPRKHDGFSASKRPADPPDSAGFGTKCAPCAPAPEVQIRAAIDGLEPPEARAVLLRILAELG